MAIGTNERDTLAIATAETVCRQGYSPDEAAQVVRLTDAQLGYLWKWYGEWASNGLRQSQEAMAQGK